MKRNNLHFGKSKNRLYTALLWVTGGACIVTSILLGSFVYTTMSINKHNVTLNKLSSEIDEMKSIAEGMMEQEKEYKKQLEGLNQELAKYEPIVIPESMKK